ncbi:hypothetical protein N9L68_07185 [bacterium]|nr:hypothetical protein [bacterium]
MVQHEAGFDWEHIVNTGDRETSGSQTPKTDNRHTANQAIWDYLIAFVWRYSLPTSADTKSDIRNICGAYWLARCMVDDLRARSGRGQQPGVASKSNAV